MNGDAEDRSLRELFNRLAEARAQQIPSFDGLLNNARRRQSSGPARLPRSALGLAGVLAIFCSAVWVAGHRATGVVLAHPPSITTWQSPTQFLLRVQ